MRFCQGFRCVVSIFGEITPFYIWMFHTDRTQPADQVLESRFLYAVCHTLFLILMRITRIDRLRWPIYWQ